MFLMFSFKRFNGAFGYFYTDNNVFKIQFMRKIKTSNFVILLMGFYRETNKNHFVMCCYSSKLTRLKNLPKVYKMLPLTLRI